MTTPFLTLLGVGLLEIEEAILRSPSLRGFLVGYIAERRLTEMYLSKFNPIKHDDHDRTKKGDRWIDYNGIPISIESKSLQTNSVKKAGDEWRGNFQCDASDSRMVSLPNGERIKTVCLVVGGFDLLAVNLFEFGHKWRFAFARNRDLPRSKSPKYTASQREYLLQTTPPITWPLKPPYEAEPWALLDAIAQEKASGRSGSKSGSSSRAPETKGG